MSCEVRLLWFVRRSFVQRHVRSVNTCSPRNVKRSRPSKILSEEYEDRGRGCYGRLSTLSHD
jgi:hypothetical protein